VLVIDAARPGDAGNYDCVVSNSIGAVASPPALLLVERCISDLNNDGLVDPDDLLLVLGSFGCAGGGCPGDADGDADTDLDDLLVVLGYFDGGCP
jgi:hypothetical protein